MASPVYAIRVEQVALPLYPQWGTEERGLQFTARRLAVQLDLLILAFEESRPTEEIQELCRERRVVLDYAAIQLGGEE